MSDLYKHPEQYDREHLGDEEDIGFYLSLSRRLAPRRVLELGCGTGRITLPLAQLGFDVVGLDNQLEMLQKAEERRLQAPSEIRQRLQFIEGDMRTWSAGTAFDLILIPASANRVVNRSMTARRVIAMRTDEVPGRRAQLDTASSSA